MPWQHIQGHDSVVERFRRAALRGRLAGSFLFVGPPGVGKKMFALALAKGVLCKGHDDRSIEPCGTCDSCRLFEAREKAEHERGEGDVSKSFVSPHPDLFHVSKPPDKSFLPLELLIGDKDHRGESGICFNISRTPFLGNRKVAIIDDADFLNAEGANAILKTLEEPPSDSILILIGTSATKQLPTIRSRCQIIRFSPLGARQLASILLDLEVVSTLEQGFQLAKRAGGSLDQARDLLDNDLDSVREDLVKQLSARRFDSVEFAQKWNAFVESAGKEAPARRRRLRILFSLAIDLFRDKMIKWSEPIRSDDGAAVEERHQDEMKIAARRLERTLDALEQIDRNANLPYVVEAWCSDLRR